MKCPQNEAEFTAYFFRLINRKIEGNADDWKQVLSGTYDWNGQQIPIPKNTPPPGERHPSDAPFYGLSVQQSASGVAPRIWIPAVEPDIDEKGNRWYRRYIQVIRDSDTPGNRFEWCWWYQSGHDYVPLLIDNQKPGNGGTNPPEPTDPELQKRVQVLEQRVDSLYATLEKFALQSIANGKYVANELGDGCILRGNRDSADTWEEFKIVRKQ